MSPKQLVALSALLEGPLPGYSLYAIIWPDGRFVSRDPGSTKGGPSRAEFAVNHFMNRGAMRGLVARERLLRKERAVGQGKYYLTLKGRDALITAGRKGLEESRAEDFQTAFD